MATATLVISSKNYSSWSLRGWLMTRMSGLEFEERVVPIDDPANLKAHRPGFKIWSGAQADIERITTIWRECLSPGGGPYLFGRLGMADAMYAPVVTRFHTYDVPFDAVCAAYGRRIMALPDMIAWIEAARAEPDALEDLEVEF